MGYFKKSTWPILKQKRNRKFFDFGPFKKMHKVQSDVLARKNRWIWFDFIYKLMIQKTKIVCRMDQYEALLIQIFVPELDSDGLSCFWTNSYDPRYLTPLQIAPISWHLLWAAASVEWVGSPGIAPLRKWPLQ